MYAFFSTGNLLSFVRYVLCFPILFLQNVLYPGKLYREKLMVKRQILESHAQTEGKKTADLNLLYVHRQQWNFSYPQPVASAAAASMTIVTIFITVGTNKIDFRNVKRYVELPSRPATQWPTPVRPQEVRWQQRSPCHSYSRCRG